MFSYERGTLVPTPHMIPLGGLVRKRYARSGGGAAASHKHDWYFIAEEPAPAPHPEGCATLHIVLGTVPRVSRPYEYFPDGFDLHLLQASKSDSHQAYRCRANSENTRHSRPASGPGLSHFQCESLQKHLFVPSSAGGGGLRFRTVLSSGIILSKNHHIRTTPQNRI